MLLSSALLLAAQALSPEWAPVALVDNEGTTVYFVDRAGIQATPNGRTAQVYVVSAASSMRLHFEYDCERQRSRFLEASLDSPMAQWAPVKPQSPLHVTMRYACADGKIDFGFGDVAVPAKTPEAFAREFIARRSAAKRSAP